MPTSADASTSTWTPPPDPLAPVRRILQRAARLEIEGNPHSARHLLAEEFGRLAETGAATVPEPAALDRLWAAACERAELVAELAGASPPPRTAGASSAEAVPTRAASRPLRPSRAGVSPSVADLLEDMFASANSTSAKNPTSS